MAESDRITLVILNPEGTRDKRALQSWVGIPRKTEILWIEETPFVVVEVEYAVVAGFFGSLSVETAGIYVRRLSDEEQASVAQRLTGGPRGGDERAFRP